MKKYDVYGIGNALVDMEFQVEDSFFHENAIDKGLMTLVDEERQNTLMSVIDQGKTKMKSGGSAANTIIALSQFGGKGYYSCKVADDFLGDFYLNDLEAAGVKSNLHNKSRASGITGKCLVMITPDAERTMNTYLGITAEISPKELDQEALKDSKYLYIEGYLVASPTGFDTMLAAKETAEVI